MLRGRGSPVPDRRPFLSTEVGAGRWNKQQSRTGIPIYATHFCP